MMNRASLKRKGFRFSLSVLSVYSVVNLNPQPSTHHSQSQIPPTTHYHLPTNMCYNSARLRKWFVDMIFDIGGGRFQNLVATIKCAQAHFLLRQEIDQISVQEAKNVAAQACIQRAYCVLSQYARSACPFFDIS